MLKRKIKKILNIAGILPAIIYYRKKILPDTNDKMEAAILPKYKQFYSTFIKKDTLCFDIGAHMGSRVDVFLACGARVVAIEPFDQCFNYMKFKYGKSVVLINKGVGPDTKDKEMFASDDPTTNSFSERWVKQVSTERFKGRKWDKKIKIKMTSLDELIKTYGVPDFCKIDVEGFELEVLKGLSHTINIISFEYTVPEEKDSIIQCIDKLIALNAHYKFNYSEGETMAFDLGSFISGEEFKKIIHKEKFIQSSCGDIYASVLSF